MRAAFVVTKRDKRGAPEEVRPVIVECEDGAFAVVRYATDATDRVLASNIVEPLIEAARSAVELAEEAERDAVKAKFRADKAQADADAAEARAVELRAAAEAAIAATPKPELAEDPAPVEPIA